jgi:hypothetical protein
MKRERFDAVIDKFLGYFECDRTLVSTRRLLIRRLLKSGCGAQRRTTPLSNLPDTSKQSHSSELGGTKPRVICARLRWGVPMAVG